MNQKQTMLQRFQRLQHSTKERAGPSMPESQGQTAQAVKRTYQRKQILHENMASAQNVYKRLLFDEATPKATREAVPSAVLHNVSQQVTSELRHQAMEQNEDENVGVTAAVQVEQTGESLLHKGEQLYQHRQVRTSKAHRMDSTLQRSSNPFSRWRQKKQIREQLRAMVSGQGLSAMQSIPASLRAKASAKRTAIVVRPKSRSMLLLGIALLLAFVMNTVSACAPLTQTVLDSIVLGTYSATEEDVRAAEVAYAAKEKELKEEIDHYQQRHPGYDEYRITAADIWHDPYALIAIISAWYDGKEWTINEAAPVIEKYFALQYILTENVETITKYRTEQRTGQRLVSDGNGGTRLEEYSYEASAPYKYTICTVTLENKILSHLPVYSMSHHTMGMYALYMSTLGNMPELFAGNAHASHLREPGKYDVPEEALATDPQFARIMEEAQKYIGYPYVWGGASPETSFDCSGFVSWVYTESGVYNTGRLGATGLYGICKKITPEQAQPGDLVFFDGTMGDAADGITHVGIYVGGNHMLHCGSPIGYADLTESYWRKHFYAFGRVPYER